jgi:hypothetical protein
MAETFHSYKLPLGTGAFLRNKSLPKCTEVDSIAGHIHLLLLTSFDFGCEIWEHEFEHSQITKVWIDRVALQMKNLLDKYENRLSGIVVKAQISEKEFVSGKHDEAMVRLQKCLAIQVNGNLAATNEPFYFHDSIFISPFSTD